MFASENPSRIGLESPKHKHSLDVPLKYLKIHFKISERDYLGLEKYLVTTLMTWAISCLVLTITYIKEPITEE